MKFEQVYDFLTSKLEHELPAYITYHNVHHTKRVVQYANHLADEEKIADDDLILLKTAALFHDSGFLQHHVNHEHLSCLIARKYLPDFDYNTEQIDQICSMIMSTEIPQSPQNHVSKILCDADLYYLGGDEYEEYSDNLFAEFKRYGFIKNRSDWNIKQVNFLSSHHYYTITAEKEREEKKKLHLKRLQAIITGSLKAHQKASASEMITDFIFVILGVILAGFALKCFLVPNKFFDGGITGISLLLHELYHVNLAIVIVLLNLPLIIISYFTVGKKFAIRTIMSILLLSICLWLLPETSLTSDKLLISIFGGVFLGIGIGFVMRSGAALDGIEVLALYTLKRTSFTITEIIMAINILIFAVAAFSFGIETALYSILTYFAATRCIDYVVEGIQAYTGVTIISGKSELIKYELVNGLKRGITVYKGERGFLPGKFEVSADCDIIFTVITRLELRKLKNLVYDLDPKAFVFANTIKEAAGGIVKRRNQH